jgi:hypothetical protein
MAKKRTAAPPASGGPGVSGGFTPGENLRQAAAPLGAGHNGLGEHLLVGIVKPPETPGPGDGKCCSRCPGWRKNQ